MRLVEEVTRAEDLGKAHEKEEADDHGRGV